MSSLELEEAIRTSSAQQGAARAQKAFPSIWFFVAADCASFALFFGVFMLERTTQAPLFDASARRLDVRLGLLNTLILISSSWLLALASSAMRREDLPGVRRAMLATVGIASGFGLIKIVEYGSKVAHGITPLTNPFFGYYFVLTGVHFLHYLVGMVVLIILARKALCASYNDGSFRNWMDSGAIYWHMVDLLWVFLFQMLYLLGGR